MTNVPTGLKRPGSELWLAVTHEFDVQDHEIVLLLQACQEADLLADLQSILDDEGAMIDSPHGRKAHPCISELRAHRLVLSRLLASLRFPAEDGAARPARAGGSRGVYTFPPPS